MVFVKPKYSVTYLNSFDNLLNTPEADSAMLISIYINIYVYYTYINN